MKNVLFELFEEKKIVNRIKEKLPELFQIAELESSRAGKVGMEVGVTREKIIIALLIYQYGEKNVQAEIPITESEIDVKIFNHPVSIKTITGSSGIKAIWTVDAQKAVEFISRYRPHCDLLLVQINWGKTGGLYWIPLKAQLDVLNKLGRTNYLTPPKAGTNPRGVEISKHAIETLLSDPRTMKIEIEWNKKHIEYKPYERWLEYWSNN